MRIGVIVATLGRPEVVTELLEDLGRQTRQPDRLLFVVTKDADAPADAAERGAEVLLSPKGACAQRNAGLDAIGDDCDAVVFFDDDYVPSVRFLEEMEALFLEREDLVGLTGHVIADGVTTEGVSREDAVSLVADWDARGADPALTERSVGSLYGCNMAYRVSAYGDTRFDERLPLYGWLEDVDFSRQVGRKGVMINSPRLAGVHRGVKGGRTSGVRLGYSQIVNPVYLMRKGTLPLGQALNNMARNLAMNHARAFFPEPHVDRPGRVAGNWRAFLDIVRGRIEPDRILDF